MVHAGLLYMGPAENSDLKHALIIKDDLRSCTSLCPGDRADSDAATATLRNVVTSFGEMSWFVTD